MMLDPRLTEIFGVFESYCRSNSVRYNITINESNRQGYLVKLGDPDLVEQYMGGKINKLVAMEVDKYMPEGALFIFSTKVINEDQYKSPTRSVLLKQSPFRSSFGLSKSFGGIDKYNGRSFKKKLSEALKLKNDLVAHDNVTVIPAGTELEIHDGDLKLPDVRWKGKITNVDRVKLDDAIDKAFE